MTTQDRINNLEFALSLAKEHLDQYRAYSEEMRKIGRGLYLSSPYGAEWADQVISNALGAEEVQP